MNLKKELLSACFFIMFFFGVVSIRFILPPPIDIHMMPYNTFSFYNSNDGPVPVDNCDSGKIRVILFADPECELCLAEVKVLVKNNHIHDLGDVLVVSELLEKTKRFNGIYPQQKPEEIHFVYDKDHIFSTCFGRHSIPSVFIIKNHRLVESFQGETSINAIMIAARKN
jgi:hypothetical protein